MGVAIPAVGHPPKRPTLERKRGPSSLLSELPGTWTRKGSHGAHAPPVWAERPLGLEMGAACSMFWGPQSALSGSSCAVLCEA